MAPEEMFGQLVGLGKAWRIMKARLEASFSKSVLKVEEAAELLLGGYVQEPGELDEDGSLEV